MLLLLTNCEVHMAKIRTAVLKYGPNEIRTVQKAKDPNIFRMERTVS